MEVRLTKSPSAKFKVVLYFNGKRKKTLHFGQKGASDYTIHNDAIRKMSYIKRHQPRENWTKAGILTKGFWSRWLLWNRKTLEDSMNNIEDRFGVKFI